MRVELFGSLGATGHGHGSDRAVVLGLQGETPEAVDTATMAEQAAAARAAGRVRLLGRARVALADDDLVLHRRHSLPYHPNGMRFFALRRASESCCASAPTTRSAAGSWSTRRPPGPTGSSLTTRSWPTRSRPATSCWPSASDTGLPISEIMLANETAWRSADEVRAGLLAIWEVMQQCVRNGYVNEGTLPGGLKVPRRAPEL